jgi:3-methyladenine DNA glycosylase AlkD
MKRGFDLVPLLKLIEPMMLMKEKPVQQGLGWFLREAWKLHPELTEDFLLRWKESCGRVIVQYATEKMTPEQKERYRRSKK